MKKSSRFSLIIFLIIMIVAAWWLWPRKHNAASQMPAKLSFTNAVAASSNTQNSASLPNQPATNTTVARQVEALEHNPKVAAMQQIEATKNAKSLDFYGKAVDQYDNPVAGVKVKAGVGLYLGIDEQ